AVDAPDTTAIVAQRDLDRWAVGFDEAYAIALENLRARSVAPLGRAADGVYHSTWSDSYDPARLLLPGTPCPLALDGEPVVALPSWHHLLVTGSRNDTGVEAMIRFGLKVAEEEPKTLSALPLVRRGGVWDELDLPRGHALEPLL